jgi:hypothetical protein
MFKALILILTMTVLFSCSKQEETEVVIETPPNLPVVAVKIGECNNIKTQLSQALETQLTILPTDQLLAIKVDSLQTGLASCKREAELELSLTSPSEKNTIQYTLYQGLIEGL